MYKETAATIKNVACPVKECKAKKGKPCSIYRGSGTHIMRKAAYSAWLVEKTRAEATEVERARCAKIVRDLLEGLAPVYELNLVLRWIEEEEE